jgi:hypothetical protein
MDDARVEETLYFKYAHPSWMLRQVERRIANLYPYSRKYEPLNRLVESIAGKLSPSKLSPGNMSRHLLENRSARADRNCIFCYRTPGRFL